VVKALRQSVSIHLAIGIRKEKKENKRKYFFYLFVAKLQSTLQIKQ
jgi:hypothetical protein